MATYFISDLHLDEAWPKLADAFLHFLSYEAKQADALYILGDFFEVWVGDDDRSPFNQKIFDALKAYTDTGIPTYIMHGNRDFLIGKRFMKATGCKLLKDPTKIMLYNHPVLLMHGDLLCTDDKEYLKIRKKLRNPFRHFLFFLFKSLKQRKAFATKLREKSKERFKSIDLKITDATPEAIERYMTTHQTHYLIHGHTHRPKIHHFTLNAQPAIRAVLGAWHENPNYLSCYPSDDGRQLEFELKSI